MVLIYAQNPDKSQPRFSSSYADFLDWRKQTRSFTGMTAFTSGSLTLVGSDGEPTRISGVATTSDVFDVVGGKPLLGRYFHANDPETETSTEIILSDLLQRMDVAVDDLGCGRGVHERSVTTSPARASGMHMCTRTCKVARSRRETDHRRMSALRAAWLLCTMPARSSHWSRICASCATRRIVLPASNPRPTRFENTGGPIAS